MMRPRLKIKLTTIILFLSATVSAQPVTTYTAVIHHSGVGDLGDNMQTYRDYYQRIKGEPDVPYHYIVDSDGRIHRGRSMDEWAWDYGELARYLNVAMSGRDYTAAQIASVNMILERWLVHEVIAHSESCPGDGVGIVCEGEVCRLTLNTENHGKGL